MDLMRISGKARFVKLVKGHTCVRVPQNQTDIRHKTLVLRKKNIFNVQIKIIT